MTGECPKTKARTAARPNGAVLFFGVFRLLLAGASSCISHFLVFSIRLYRWTISPVLPFLLGPTGGCRFTPSCSQYAMDTIRSRGALTGSWLAVKRICRCHPWGGCGHDPAPDKEFGVRNSESGI